MIEPIRVLIADDHPIVRQGVRSLLSVFPDIQVVGEADSPSVIQKEIETHYPDVILLDVRLGAFNGIDLARRLRRSNPECRIIILTTYDDDEYLFGAIEAGAHAYLLKDVSLDALPASIRAVHAGRRLLSPMFVERVLQEFQRLAAKKAEQDFGISALDLEILRLMADGLTNREIAAELNYSEATVKKKVQEILETLGVSNRTQAVALAIRQGQI